MVVIDLSGHVNDGYVRGLNATYSVARSTSQSYDDGNEFVQIGQLGPSIYVLRAFLKFDTSVIDPLAYISQVNLKMVCTSDTSGTDFDVQIVKQDWSAQDPLSDANREAAYDNCLAGTADNSIWRNTSGMTVGIQYASGNLDTTWINRSGFTYYSLRSSRDFGNIEPPGSEYIDIGSQTNATVAYRPKLSITYVYPSLPSFRKPTRIWRL